MDSFPFSVSRRTFLTGLGIGTGAGLLGLSRFYYPAPSAHDRDQLILPQYAPNPVSVVVVGGGLAGLSCAYSLSERGFKVTLLEKSPQLGGKIASWPVQVGRHQFRMEHGFHGFFPQYYNLRGIVDQLRLTHGFQSLSSYGVVYRDRYSPEVFRDRRSPFPWNMLDLALASPNGLRWGIDFTSLSHWRVLREIAGYHPQTTYDRLDHLSARDWMGDHFPQGLFDLYFLPFAKSSLNALDQFSAAELVHFFHCYFFGHPEGMVFQATRQDLGRTLVEPLKQAIEQRGGKVLTAVDIDRIDWEQGKIAAVTYSQGVKSSPTPRWVKANPYLTGEGLQFFGGGDEVFAWKPGAGEALELTCPHQGCTVQPTATGFCCPCHGARFDRQGKHLQGPAPRDLGRWEVTNRGPDRIEVRLLSEQPPTSQTLRAEYFVLAADVPGMHRLADRMVGAVVPGIALSLQRLAVAAPFAVCRFWFDRDFTWPHSPFTTLSGYRLTDSIALYHHLQTDYRSWAQETGGSVVELQSYGYKEQEFPDQVALLHTFEQELLTIVPDLASAKVLHRELVNQTNFSGYPPGSFADRPTTTTPASNLFLAGDWVKMPFPCSLMERAVSSGLLAANHILQSEGIQRRVLYSVQPTGLLSWLT